MKKKNPGLSKELEASRTFHAEGTPLLVSSALLRSRILGQVDLVRLRKDQTHDWLIEMGEVKSSSMGEEMMMRGQIQRLYEAQKFLGQLLGKRTKLIRIVK